MEKEYYEEAEEIDDELEQELTKEQLELREIEKEQSTKLKNGQVEFRIVNHSERAAKFGRVSDGDTTKYVNVALEYFGHRCALSGERFESFDKKVDGKKSNLSAEHVVALCLGGDDIVPNIVPTVLQYNLRKNGYYLLDYWDKQKDTEGKSLYSPYRLLKLVNYMMKSIEARDLKTVKDYRKAIMTPNAIDEFLAEIEKQDELEPDNSKKKIHSDTITATTVDEDNKKILTEVPQVEGNIPTQREQQERFRQNEIDMMDVFLFDAIGLLNRTQELKQVRLTDKDGNEISLQDKLNDMLKSTIGVIPFEVEVRNAILEKLETLGIKDNKYSVANDLLNNAPILEIAKENKLNEKKVEEVVEEYLNRAIDGLRTVLTEEQVQVAISHKPNLIYEENTVNRIKLWKEYRTDDFEELIKRGDSSTDRFVDVLIILKKYEIDLTNIKRRSKIQDLIKEKSETIKKQILKELKDIIGDEDENWKIGEKLTDQKKYKNLEVFRETIKKVGIKLTEEEKNKILEREISSDATQDLVKVLIVLKRYEIDLTKIKRDVNIDGLLEEKSEEERNKILKELKDIIGDKSEKWPIGGKLNTQKLDRNIENFKQALEESGMELTEAEKKKLIERLVSENATQDLVKVLIVLKRYEIDLTKITQSGNIENLLEEKNEEEREKILKDLKTIVGDNSEKWPIGDRLSRQKSNENIGKFKQTLDESGIELTEEERKKILEREKSLDATQDLVDVLTILKRYEIDLTKIKSGINIENLLEEKSEEEKNTILEELKDIIGDNTEKWPIGDRLFTQKSDINIGKFKNALDKSGIELTEKERKKLIEKGEGSKNATQDLVDVLNILKRYKIDLTQITQDGNIENLLEEKNEEEREKILKDLKTIIGEKCEKWPIGDRLTTQKLNKNIGEFKQVLEESGIKLTKGEVRKLTEIENATQDLVDVLNILKKYKIDLTKITQRGNIESLLEEKSEEERNRILKELKDIIGDNAEKWPIGNRLNTQKSDKNIGEFENALKESGIELTEKERKKLIEKGEGSKNATQDLVDVLNILKRYKIDLTKITQDGNIENLLEEKNEEEREKILKDLKTIVGDNSEKWPIGKRLNTQKTDKNIGEFKQALEESGIKLTKGEIRKLTEIENATQDLVDVLIILKRYEIDLTKITQQGNIGNLLEGKSEKERNEILEELKDIIGDKREKWPIGSKLNDQKKDKNIERFKKTIKESDLELTEAETRKLTEKKVKKKVKQTVVEQKNKGELGQNQQIEAQVFEETIRQAEQTQVTETSAR